MKDSQYEKNVELITWNQTIDEENQINKQKINIALELLKDIKQYFKGRLKDFTNEEYINNSIKGPIIKVTTLDKTGTDQFKYLTELIIPITGDGNCAYRSLSYFLFGTEQYYKSVKALGILTVYTEFEKYKNMITVNHNILPNASEYLRYIQRPGVFGALPEIIAVLDYFERSIEVVMDYTSPILIGSGLKINNIYLINRYNHFELCLYRNESIIYYSNYISNIVSTGNSTIIQSTADGFTNMELVKIGLTENTCKRGLLGEIKKTLKEDIIIYTKYRQCDRPRLETLITIVKSLSELNQDFFTLHKKSFYEDNTKWETIFPLLMYFNPATYYIYSNDYVFDNIKNSITFNLPSKEPILRNIVDEDFIARIPEFMSIPDPIEPRQNTVKVMTFDINENFEEIIKATKIVETEGKISNTAKAFNRMIHERHDSFGRHICEELNYPFSSDCSAFDLFCSLFGPEEMDRKLLGLNAEIVKNIKYRTPDLVLNVDRTTYELVDHPDLILVIDFAVTVNKDLVQSKKKDKYDIYKLILPENILFQYVTYGYDIINEESFCDPEILNIVDINDILKNLIKDSQSIKNEFMNKYASNEEFIQIVQKDLDYDEEVFRMNMSYSFSIQEFNLNPLSKMLDEILIESNFKDEFWNLVENCYIRNENYPKILNKYENLGNQLYSTININSKTDFIVPEEKVIMKAISDLKVKASTHFKPIKTGKMLCHFPLVHYNNKLVDISENTFQLSILKDISLLFSKIKIVDPIVSSLMKIFRYEKVEIKQLEEAKFNGKPLYLYSDGTATTFKTDSLPDGSISHIVKDRGVVLPNNKHDFDSLKLLIGGFKDKNDIAFEDKVESLDYWNKIQFDEHLYEYDEMKKEDIDLILTKSGSGSEQFKEYLNNYSKDTESFYQNLSFIMQFGCKGYRFCFCSNPNIVGLVFPGESILKSKAKRSYIIIINNSNNDLVLKFQGEYHKVGDLLISKGRSENLKTISCRNKSFARYVSVTETIKQLFLQNGMDINENLYSVYYDLLILTHNININNSSLLDNLRYLANNVMADFSAAHQFITDKMLLPCKNIFQIYLLNKTINFLIVARQDSLTILCSKGEEIGGELDVDELRIAEGSIHSFLHPTFKYKSPESLISEVITLFFSTSKALHDPVHNIKNLYKVPVEIQKEIDISNLTSGKKYNIIGNERHQFNIDFVIACTLKACNDVNVSNEKIRENICKKSFIELNPLLVKTMTSTRSMIKESHKDFNYNLTEDVTEYLCDNFKLSKDDFIKVQDYLSNCNLILSKNMYNRDKMKYIKLEKKKLPNEEVFKKLLSMTFIDYTHKSVRIRDRRMDKLISTEFLENDSILYHSIPVLTGMLEDNMNDSNATVGSKAKAVLISDKQLVFAVRPKGQRTQNDREIYVGNKEAKYVLFSIEHTVEQICKANIYERISDPGDKKIITLKNQVEDSLKFINRTSKLVENNHKKPKVMNFNVDFTKWSPRDNTLKYLFAIAAIPFLKVGEKLGLILCILKHYNKLLYLEPDFLLDVKINNNKLKELDVNYDCIFESITKEFSTSLIPIKENWLQGQLNYFSSLLHAGMIGIINTNLKRHFGPYTKFQHNVHSDDHQSTICTFDDKTNLQISTLFINSLIGCGKFLTIEPSIKKSFCSSILKEFVSQVNYGGEQKSFWVKPTMAIVSGLPYTTVHDDISSILSKASDALSKGANDKMIKKIIDATKRHVKFVYGLTNSKDDSISSDILSIREEFLPMCLGNSNVDSTLLAVIGPSSQNKYVLMKLLTHCGADEKIPPKNLPESAEVRKALKLFILFDRLSNSIRDGDDIDTTFNPFKSIKFKVRSFSKKDPFKDHKDDRIIQLNNYKRNFPVGLALKPRTFNLLLEYYNALYLDNSFKSAIAGQSPDMLEIKKIIARRSPGNFSFKTGVDVRNTSFDEKQIFNFPTLCTELNRMMLSFELKLSDLQYLWKYHINSDIDFGEAFYTINTYRKAGETCQPNLIPILYKLRKDKGSLTNNFSTLMLYYFEPDRFNSEKRELKSYTHSYLDLLTIIEMMPDLGAILIEMALSGSKNINNDYRKLINNYNIEANTKNRIDEILERSPNSSTVLIESYIVGLTSEKPLSVMIEVDKYNIKEGEFLSEFLKRKANLGLIRRDRVYFVPKWTKRNVRSLCLGLKAGFTLKGGKITLYDIPVDKAFRGSLMHDRFGLEINSLNLKAEKFSNVYSLLNYLNISNESMKEIMQNLSIDGTTMTTMLQSFKSLSHRSKNILMLPMLFLFSNKCDKLLNDINHEYEDWTKVQTDSDDTFSVRYLSSQFIMVAEGYGKNITKFHVKHVDSDIKNFNIKKILSKLTQALCRNRQRESNDLILNCLEYDNKVTTSNHIMLSYNSNSKRIDIVNSNSHCKPGFRIIKGSKFNKIGLNEAANFTTRDLKFITGLEVVLENRLGCKAILNHRDSPFTTNTGIELPRKNINVNGCFVNIKNYLNSRVTRNILEGDLSSIMLDSLCYITSTNGEISRCLGAKFSEQLMLNLMGFHYTKSANLYRDQKDIESLKYKSDDVFNLFLDSITMPKQSDKIRLKRIGTKSINILSKKVDLHLLIEHCKPIEYTKNVINYCSMAVAYYLKGLEIEEKSVELSTIELSSIEAFSLIYPEEIINAIDKFKSIGQSDLASMLRKVKQKIHGPYLLVESFRNLIRQSSKSYKKLMMEMGIISEESEIDDDNMSKPSAKDIIDKILKEEDEIEIARLLRAREELEIDEKLEDSEEEAAEVIDLYAMSDDDDNDYYDNQPTDLFGD
nr:MAG: RNA-dependent RNA polymerase [Beetle peribunya-like virus]